MQRSTRGINDVIRTHRISMPVEETMVAKGLANACNACHLDKSIRWTLAELQKGWGREITPRSHWESSEKLDLPAGNVWLNSHDSHMRLLATQYFARQSQGDQSVLKMLIQALNDSERINRLFAGFAVSKMLEQAPDQPLPVNVFESPAIRQQQITSWLNDLELPQPNDHTSAE
jgi:hypothetical protein